MTSHLTRTDFCRLTATAVRSRQRWRQGGPLDCAGWRTLTADQSMRSSVMASGFPGAK
jgi:hypothetical protein